MGIEFSIIHQINRGAAWGVLADFQFPLLILRIALVVALIAYLFFSKKHPTWRIPLTLVVAGALGNIIDYFFYGHVIDMFLFRFWGYDYPVFNVADSAIVIGIFWLFCASFFDKPANDTL
jgi:signal peptidase II